MTYTNTDINQAVSAFHRLSTNDQLASLAAAYKDISSSATFPVSGTSGTHEVNDLVKHVKDLRQEDQVQFLIDALSDKQTSKDAIALDPHPSKAMLELVPGAAKPLIDQYRELSTSSRLAFWYQLAQELSDVISSKLSGYQFSSEATELGNSLKNLDLEQKVNFLNQIV